MQPGRVGVGHCVAGHLPVLTRRRGRLGMAATLRRVRAAAIRSCHGRGRGLLRIARGGAARGVLGRRSPCELRMGGRADRG
jgi:hypothetical protein